MSFLEMLDVVNEGLVVKGKDAIAFDSELPRSRSGGLLQPGGETAWAHGTRSRTTVFLASCIFGASRTARPSTIEPWRAKAFPVVKDLVVDPQRVRYRIIGRPGGYCSINAGGPQDANNILIQKAVSDLAMDSAACIGCGACRRGLQERVGAPLHERQISATSRCCRRVSRNGTRACWRWSIRPTAKGVRELLELRGDVARRCARRRFRSRTSRA